MATPRKRPSAEYAEKPADLAVLELDTTLPPRTQPKADAPAPAYRGVSTGLLAPDEPYLRSLRIEKQAEFAEQDQQIDEMRRVRTLTNKIILPDEARFVDVEVREPIIADEIQRVVATLTLNRPKLQVKAARPGETAEKNATLREQATEEILWAAGTRITGRNTFREKADYCAGDGGGWSKFLFTRDTWEARYALRRAQFDQDETAFLNAIDEEKKACGVPFVWEAVDARTLYPTMSMGKLTEVLEITKRPIHSALRQYRLGLDRQGKLVPEALGLPINEIDAAKMPQTVTFYEHWDAEWCFPAETPVNSDSKLTGGYKRWYEGKLTTIATAGGRQLSGTPNHPVLTARGWVPLGQLVVGDRVICRTRQQDVAAVDPHEQHADVPIGEVFDLLASQGTHERRMGSRHDFHGDGQDRQVDVVRTDGQLLSRLKPTLAQPGGQLRLVSTDQPAATLAGQGHVVAHARAADSAEVVVPSTRSHGNSNLGRETLGSYLRRFPSAADRNPQQAQSDVDAAGVGAEGGRDLDGAFSEFDVATDDVVVIERKAFQGYVYNLATERHYYAASDIVVHNCTYLLEGSYGDAQVVKQFKHRYGRVPYFYAPGYVFPWQTNNKVGWGVAQSKRWLVEYLSFLETLDAQQAARDTFAPFYRVIDPTKPGIMGKNGKPIASERYKLGQIINGPPGSSLQAFPFPQTSAALNQQINSVKEAINRLLTPRITSEIGGGPGGLEGAGFAINQVLSESRIYLDPLSQSIAASLTEITKFMWHLIRTRVRETVWVEQSSSGAGWLGLGPDDLTSGVGVSWELDPERPSAKLIEERYWHERMKAGTASTTQAIEAMGDNPDEVRFQRDMEAIRAEPWYIQWRQSYILKELGRGDILAKAAAAAASTGELPGIPGSNPGNMLPPGQPPGAVPPGPPQLPPGGAMPMAPGGPPPGMGPPTSGPQPAGIGSMGGGTPAMSQVSGAGGIGH